MREKVVSRCLPYPEIEKTEGSLWETVFLFPGFFCLRIFMLRLILRLDFQKSMRISRQISRQKE